MTSRSTEIRKREWQNEYPNLTNFKIRYTNLTYSQALEKEEEIANSEGRYYSAGGERNPGVIYSVYTFEA